MTKSKNGMVTRGITYLVTDTFPELLIESKFPLLLMALIDIHPHVVVVKVLFSYFTWE